MIDEIRSTLPPPGEALGNLLDGPLMAPPFNPLVTGTGSGEPGGGGVLDNTVVEKAALPLNGNQPPRYPDLLRRTGITGVVVVEFIIDSNGRVRPGSVIAKRADDPRFLEAVREALGTHRFLPAEAGRRAVPVRVRQVFTFELVFGANIGRTEENARPSGPPRLALRLRQVQTNFRQLAAGHGAISDNVGKFVV